MSIPSGLETDPRKAGTNIFAQSLNKPNPIENIFDLNNPTVYNPTVLDLFCAIEPQSKRTGRGPNTEGMYMASRSKLSALQDEER